MEKYIYAYIYKHIKEKRNSINLSLSELKERKKNQLMFFREIYFSLHTNIRNNWFSLIIFSALFAFILIFLFRKFVYFLYSEIFFFWQITNNKLLLLFVTFYSPQRISSGF